jgi:L-fucose isomerase-like protein
VIQEISLAKQVAFHCGNLAASFEDLAPRLRSMCAKVSNLGKRLAFGNNVTKRVTNRPFGAIVLNFKVELLLNLFIDSGIASSFRTSIQWSLSSTHATFQH